ncbi:MAG TPA: NAD(P)H-dependent glycerol-3-phosphate dehydrogenase [Thermoanaerobaculia bacterium]|nr:NAD(P)H-dependent glycerol-3-phosphate dehydrogenase [Thermoanaerobaculia bacterium]
MKISVIGAGTFGTAVAASLARGGNEVLLWAHEPNVAAEIRSTGMNPMYLRDIRLGDRVRATGDLAEAATFSDVVFMVTPSHFYRSVLGDLSRHVAGGVNICSGTKGLELDSLDRMSQVARAVLGDKLANFAVLSGPTFAVELARGDPTAAVIASRSVEFAQKLQHALSSNSWRLYRSADVVGVELGGSLKNVIAIAAGVIAGLGLGSNTNAALITRGLHEITRLGMTLGGTLETFAGLAGIGDLVLTCTGALSRNRSVGVALGQGKKLNEILDEAKFVAEGVKTSKAAKALAERYAIEMPITTEMYRVLYEDEPPRAAIHRLMTRTLKAESAL